MKQFTYKKYVYSLERFDDDEVRASLQDKDKLRVRRFTVNSPEESMELVITAHKAMRAMIDRIVSIEEAINLENLPTALELEK